MGLACLMHVGGGAKIYKSDGCGTLIKVDDFGNVDVYSGSMDIGQGLDTILRQIVAETLGTTTEKINVIIGDTDVCPWDVGVHASRSTFIAGNSALGAAQQVRDQILTAAAGILGVPRESLDLYGGKVTCDDDPEKNTAIDKILRKAHFASAGNTMFMAAHFYEPPTDFMGGDFKANYSMSYTWGCHGVEVEVDTQTGQVEIIRYIAAHEVGRALNPLLVKGQIYGAALQGVGYALAEEMIYDQGKLLNPNFRDYKMLTAMDALPGGAHHRGGSRPGRPLWRQGHRRARPGPHRTRHRQRHLRRGGHPHDQAAHQVGRGAGGDLCEARKGGGVGHLALVSSDSRVATRA